MRKLAVVGLQLDLRAEDNLARIGAEVAAVKRRFPWVDLVLLPELCAYGPSLEHAESEDGPAERAFRHLAQLHGIWLVPGSLFQRHGDRIYNVAPVIDRAGEVVARARKLFPFRPYEEGVTPGDSFCVVPIEGVGRVGISICYDLWFPEITRSLVCLGAEALLVPSLTNTIDRDAELALARANAASNQCYVVNVNTGSPLGVGKSIVCGPGGEVIHEAGSHFEVFPIELDLDHVDHVRRHGWHGLGQPLKSFRDSTISFPAYRRDGTSDALDALGPLSKQRQRDDTP
jgi:predicted amidohydrolase